MITIKNNSKVDLAEIPVLSNENFRKEIIEKGLRPLGFFGAKCGENGACISKEEKNSTPKAKIRLFAALADDKNGEIFVTSTVFEGENASYNAITNEIPSFHIFEREFFEEFKIEPKNHPWLKPVRKNLQNYEFFKMEGDEVHEVAVGPIHAGVIEPGHFRFMCNGETVYHLEICLGYQHRGIENLILKNPVNQLAESISGDSVVGHNLAFSTLIETLADIKISKRAELIRLFALEAERAAIHIGDLGAIAGDIGYLMGSAVFGAVRTLVINTMLEISGSRFARGLVTVGGVNFDILESEADKYIQTLEKVKTDVDRMVKTMLKNSTVMSRLEKTGMISSEKAREMGLVGMMARSSGVDIDSRFDFNKELLEELNVERKPVKGAGDVNSRFKLRYKEIKESISIMKKVLLKLKEDKGGETISVSGFESASGLHLSKNSFAISIVEGWRGEIVHFALTDGNGGLARYKIKDPSFNNWYGLAYAVRNNGISDFPLCNKSCNLSYAGFDL